jgi:hypothetical protein
LHECGEATFDVQRPVSKRTQPNAVLLSVELTAWSFLIRRGSRKSIVAVQVAAEPEANRVDTGAVPGFWNWAAVRGAALDET